MESEARLYDFDLTRFLHADRYPSSGQARGHASLENASKGAASDPVAERAGDGMIRGIFRSIGLLLLAGGFIFLVYDGARSIADQTVRLTKLGEFWNDIHQVSQQAVRTQIEASAPWLWDLVKLVLNQPAFAVLAVAGILLMLLFRPRRPLIGYSRD
jgi:hypothetical protein